MVQPTLVPWAKFGLPVSLLSTIQVLAQAPIVQNELHHDVSKPLRELAVTMPSGILKADELEMLALIPGFQNMGRGGQGRD